MTCYLIYFQDNIKNNVISIRDTYRTKNDAIINLERIALDYVKKAEGEKQADICKQDKTLLQITNDTTLRNGLYIIKQTEIILLCEKSTKIVAGSLWNGYNTTTEQIGVFGFIEYKFDDNFINFSEHKNITKEIKNEIIVAPSFLDELKKIINTDGKFNLKPVKKQIIDY